VILPAISPKLYQAIVTEMVRTPFGPERTRLSALQRQLAEAQMELAAGKVLGDWAKAG